MTDFIISDLHLHRNQKYVPELFYFFMQQIAPQADNLFVLGDLFEYWVGDDGCDEFQQGIITEFHHYSENHGLYFMHGNRDFLLGDFFIQKTQGIFLQDPCKMSVGGKTTLLMHGDSLCTNDTEYQHFRTMVRNPQWQQQFLSQPLQQRIEVAMNLRDKSMDSQETKSAVIMDVCQETVLQIMESQKVDRLIHGHTHRQYHHHFEVDEKPVERIVLGDWGRKGNYCVCENGSARLINFTLNG